MHSVDTIVSLSRDEIIGHPTYTKISDLGVRQFRHAYDAHLIEVIARKAEELRYTAAEKRHLNLKFIRNAHTLIPEILELVNQPGRIDKLSALAGTELEIYPVSVISSIITFQGHHEDEGSIVWHADGIPVTEMVPLRITDLQGGALELYSGDPERGLWSIADNKTIPESQIISISHRMGYGILGQLMRLVHRVAPISAGSRITLNMNLRSKEKPYIDDNSMFYLAADNPEGSWKEEYIDDVFQCKLPKYLKDRST